MANLITILLGLHSYSLSPEEETAWSRVYIVIGWMLGVATAATVFEVMR